MKSRQTERKAPTGLHLLMGPDAGLKFDNLLRNLRQDRVKVVQAGMERVR